MLILRRLVAKLQALQSDNKEEYKVDPYVELYLNPNCKHTVTIRASLGEMWAQMVNLFVNNDKQLLKILYLNPFIEKMLLITGSFLWTDDSTLYRFCVTIRAFSPVQIASTKKGG